MKVTEQHNLIIIRSDTGNTILVITKNDAADLHQQLGKLVSVADIKKDNEWRTSLSFSGQDMGWGPKTRI